MIWNRWSSSVFQAYSCVSLAGLWIVGGGVNQSAVKAHAKVLAFYGRHGG